MNASSSQQWILRLSLAATAIAVCVVVLGAWVRLTDAGLGCPDWPGCYGHIGVPDTPEEVAAANAAYPERPVETQKAWNEMIHRYLASFLGLVILVIAWLALKERNRPHQLVALPLGLVALVILQGLMGMWTVTLLLKPAVVTAHLLGGMATTSLLFWLALRHGRLFTYNQNAATARWLPWSLVGLGILTMQIALGGWTSTNYAALACPDFPTCHGQWMPWWDADQAFQVWHGLGQDFEGGVLSNEARVTIHATHRLGALVTFLYIGGLALWIAVSSPGLLRIAACLVLILLGIQVALGIANIVMYLPLSIAVAHNGVAALLLLSLVTLIHVINPRQAT
ncbi:MAG: COX15/CtaA family protein [Pseudomonadota bacterium]